MTRGGMRHIKQANRHGRPRPRLRDKHCTLHAGEIFGEWMRVHVLEFSFSTVNRDLLQIFDQRGAAGTRMEGGCGGRMLGNQWLVISPRSESVRTDQRCL